MFADVIVALASYLTENGIEPVLCAPPMTSDSGCVRSKPSNFSCFKREREREREREKEKERNKEREREREREGERERERTHMYTATYKKHTRSTPVPTCIRYRDRVIERFRSARVPGAVFCPTTTTSSSSSSSSSRSLHLYLETNSSIHDIAIPKITFIAFLIIFSFSN